MVGRVRFELTTIRLKVECSTTELPAHIAKGLKSPGEAARTIGAGPAARKGAALLLLLLLLLALVVVGEARVLAAPLAGLGRRLRDAQELRLRHGKQLSRGAQRTVA